MGAPYIYDISRLRVNVHGSVYRNNILIYIQQDATLHSLSYLETAVHVSGGTTTNCQERKQLYLQHLVFVTVTAIAAGSSNGVYSLTLCQPVLRPMAKNVTDLYSFHTPCFVGRHFN